MPVDEKEFELLIKIAKSLTLKLSNERDRIVATKWIKKLQNTKNPDDKNRRDHYVKLLLLTLQRKRLVGPFKTLPDQNSSRLNILESEYQPNDISKLILAEEFKLYGCPPYAIEASGDLTEYCVYQEIPQFGAHFYYAYSPDPLPKWFNFEKAILPKGSLAVKTISCPDTSILPLAKETILHEAEVELDEVFPGPSFPNPNLNITKQKELSVIDTSLDKTILTDQGTFHDNFLKVIGSSPVDTNLLEKSIQSGIVNESDLGLKEMRSRIEKIPLPPLKHVTHTSKRTRGVPGAIGREGFKSLGKTESEHRDVEHSKNLRKSTRGKPTIFVNQIRKDSFKESEDERVRLEREEDEMKAKLEEDFKNKILENRLKEKEENLLRLRANPAFTQRREELFERIEKFKKLGNIQYKPDGTALECHETSQSKFMKAQEEDEEEEESLQLLTEADMNTDDIFGDVPDQINRSMQIFEPIIQISSDDQEPVESYDLRTAKQKSLSPNNRTRIHPVYGPIAARLLYERKSKPVKKVIQSNTTRRELPEVVSKSRSPPQFKLIQSPRPDNKISLDGNRKSPQAEFKEPLNKKDRDHLIDTMVNAIEQSEKFQDLKKRYLRTKGLEAPDLSFTELLAPLERLVEDNLLNPTQYREQIPEKKNILDEPYSKQLLPDPLLKYSGSEESELTVKTSKENPLDAYEKILDEEELINYDLIENDDMFADENIADPNIFPKLELLIDFLKHPEKESPSKKAFSRYCAILNKLKSNDKKHEMPLFCNFVMDDLNEEEMPDYSDEQSSIAEKSDENLFTQQDVQFRSPIETLFDKSLSPRSRVGPIMKSQRPQQFYDQIQNKETLSRKEIAELLAEQQTRPAYFGTTPLLDFSTYMDKINDSPIPVPKSREVPADITNRRARNLLWFDNEQPSTSEEEIDEIREEIDEPEKIAEKETWIRPDDELPWEIVAARLVHKREKELIAQGLIPDPKNAFKKTKPVTKIVRKIQPKIRQSKTLTNEEKMQKIDDIMKEAENQFQKIYHQFQIEKQAMLPQKTNKKVQEIPQLRIPRRERIFEDLNKVPWEEVASKKVKSLEKKLMARGLIPDPLNVLRKTRSKVSLNRKTEMGKVEEPKELTREEKIQKIQEVLRSAEQNFANLYYQNEQAKQKPPSRNMRKPVQTLQEIPPLKLPRWEPITENLDKVAWELVAVRKVKAMEKKLKEAGLLPDVKPPAKTPVADRSKILKKPQIKKKIIKPVITEQVVPPSKEEQERLIAEVLKAADINFARRIYEAKLEKERQAQSKFPPWKRKRN